MRCWNGFGMRKCLQRGKSCLSAPTLTGLMAACFLPSYTRFATREVAKPARWKRLTPSGDNANQVWYENRVVSGVESVTTSASVFSSGSTGITCNVSRRKENTRKANKHQCKKAHSRLTHNAHLPLAGIPNWISNEMHNKNLFQGKRLQGTGIFILIISIIFVSVGSSNAVSNTRMQRQKNYWKSVLQNSHLIGKTPSEVSSYLDRNGVPHGEYDDGSGLVLELDSSPRRKIEAEFLGVGKTLTLSQGPMIWDLRMQFIFDERNKMKSFEVWLSKTGL